MKYVKWVPLSESVAKIEFGDRGSQPGACCVSCKIQEISKKSKSPNPAGLILARIAYSSKQKFLRHEVSQNFAHLQNLGHRTHVGFGNWSKLQPYLKFSDFSKSNIFDNFDFSRKLTIGPNDLGETRESLSRLDLAIPSLDIAPTHAGNRTFWVKNRDFSNLEQNSGLWSYINQIELHQQNSILLM